MPKFSRWIVAYKMVEVLDHDTIKGIIDKGGHIGGGWNQVHMHVAVNQENKEAIEKLLMNQGFTVEEVSQVFHPEIKHEH